MEKIGNRSRILNKFPSMSSSLENKLGYNGMTTWGYDILNEVDIGEEIGNSRTRNFFNNLN